MKKICLQEGRMKPKQGKTSKKDGRREDGKDFECLDLPVYTS